MTTFMKRKRLKVFNFIILLLCLIIFSFSLPSAEQVKGKLLSIPPDLDKYIFRVMKTFEVPGLAVAIIKDGQVLLAKGYGVRRLGENTPVDSRTLFGIASNSKFFTATALAMLVEEGKVSWDSPVINYLPSFQLWDPYVTREITVRALVCHRSGLGLGAGDLLWWPPSDYNRKEIIRRMRYIKPASSFRSTYAYNNLMFLVAGEVIEVASGLSWEDFIQQRILGPLGMKNTSPRISDLPKKENVAATHAEVEGEIRFVKPFLVDTINPAGGIISCAEDMARWVLCQLNEGRIDGDKRLFSERTARELGTMLISRPISPAPPELPPLKVNFLGYGYGLSLRDYRGWKIMGHTGGLPGYVSQVTMVPDLELGIVVLTNQESTEAFNSITYFIIDYYLKAPTFDWVTGFQKLRERRLKEIQEIEKKAEAARDAASKPSLPLEKYAGLYTDDWYGDIEITWTGEKLRLRFTRTPLLIGDMIHWQYNTFMVRWDDRELRADAYITFNLNHEGLIEEAKMRPVSPATDFSFDFQDLLLRPKKTAAKKN
ncbi:MAG: serine hydrolase [Candidatus Aminicenantes bacterium]|nr:serine hydrolase [Candidatus Aminicenantes bacterium]